MSKDSRTRGNRGSSERLALATPIPDLAEERDEDASAPPTGRMVDRPVSARIDERIYRTLMQISAVLRQAGLAQSGPADLIRTSLKEYLDARLNDPKLPDRLDRAQAKQRAILAAIDPSLDSGEPVQNLPAPIPIMKTKGEKQITLRIDDRTYDLLMAFALLDETGMADQVRMAVYRYVNSKSEDRLVQDQMQRVAAANAGLLDALQRTS